MKDEIIKEMCVQFARFWFTQMVQYSYPVVYDRWITTPEAKELFQKLDESEVTKWKEWFVKV